MQLAVTVHHDAASGVWYVHDSELPGLHAEAPTLDALVAIIEDVAPDLMETNLPRGADGAVPPTELRVQHVVRAKPARAA
ncbi:hypothetical protein ASG52_10850 [Methylobacterium sp. Leaf456]|uniref:DUF1902 domain-containing protein n=1 Tax=Methylobacterium sp. Leaf456 TaxID=1736382 RepID=UPI0006FAC0ED|nr:DUF1902 domain-containing protein [Methylobacterium sp. Leaf456]KQT47757.1 hypothetical protein ASG52_10850 [Methylobacterium sp. Leaf456]